MHLDKPDQNLTHPRRQQWKICERQVGFCHLLNHEDACPIPLFVREPKTEPYGTVAVFEDLYGNQWDLLELNNPPSTPE